MKFQIKYNAFGRLIFLQLAVICELVTPVLSWGDDNVNSTKCETKVLSNFEAPVAETIAFYAAAPTLKWPNQVVQDLITEASWLSGLPLEDVRTRMMNFPASGAGLIVDMYRAQAAILTGKADQEVWSAVV